MTIAALQTSVESWLERELDDALFLTFANAVAGKLMAGVLGADGRTWIVPPLRVREMLTQDTLTVTDGVAPLPADWLEFERLYVAGSNDIGYAGLTQFAGMQQRAMTGWPPLTYTIDGDSVLTAPSGSGDLSCTYFQKLGAFTGDGSTDVVLTAHPHVYLAGCIAEACGWIGDQAREDREGAKFAALVRGLNGATRQAQTTGSLLVMRPQSVA